jgi:ABC-type dipeptide/oligopeptide/nickel transport system ATPase subunit
MTARLVVKHLYKRFAATEDDAWVLEDINFSIEPGEIVGLAGMSGSGKSTLARCISGLLSRNSGEVTINGQSMPKHYRASDFKRQAPHLQMIFQDPLSSLNPQLTLEETLTEPLKLNTDIRHNDCRELAAQWLTRMGLRKDDLSRYPHSFSGGQLQRIGIARALISKPSLLVCDEPVSALDVSVQAQIVNLLLDLRAEFGLSLLFIGHDLAMMRYLCDRIILLENGKMAKHSPDQAFSSALS